MAGWSLYQTELSGSETPPWFGSPGSPVAPTFVCVNVPPAPTSIAFTQLSLTGTIVTFRLTEPTAPLNPATAIVYSVFAFAVNVIELWRPQESLLLVTGVRPPTPEPV